MTPPLPPLRAEVEASKPAEAAVYKKKKEILTIIPVAFIGGTLFHMIWEAKSRYVFPYFVFLIPIAAYGLIIFRNKIIEYRKTKEEKNEKSNM